jgi:hypothetical protein
MSQLQMDISEWEAFFKLVGKSEAEFKKEVQKFAEAIGNEFLRIVEEEIKRTKTMDTRLLLNSFEKNGDGSVWTITDNGTEVSVEVGTEVKYAAFVNDGHWTNPNGVKMRWVPGYWKGKSFVYDPGAKTGMLLKQKWVPGKHYFDSALRIMDQMLPKLLEAKFDNWLGNYLGL